MERDSRSQLVWDGQEWILVDWTVSLSFERRPGGPTLWDQVTLPESIMEQLVAATERKRTELFGEQTCV